MSRRVSWKAGVVALTGACLALASPAPAGALAKPFEGYNASDPIGSAAGELKRLVREQCELSGRFTVGVGSLPVDVQAFTRDQGNHLMSVVHAAFSRMTDIRLAPFRDIGAILELRSEGMTQTANAGNVEELLNAVDIVVNATGQRAGAVIRFQLTAASKKGKFCQVYTPPVDLPASMAGEVFKPIEQIFSPVAMELWDRVRGPNQVAVQSRLASGQSVDAALPGYFVSKFRQAVSSARKERTREFLHDETELEVVERAEATADGPLRWNADIMVEPGANGYKINIDVHRPQTTSISHTGIVALDELPALRRADLSRVAAIARPSPPRQSNRPQQAAQARAAAPGEAAVIQFSAAPTRIQDSLDDQTREQRYAFRLDRESFVEFDVQRLSGASQIITPDLAGANGMPIKASFEGKARPNLRRYRLPPGQYEVRLQTEGAGRTEYVFSSRAVDIGRMLEPEAPGRLTRRFQDWYAGEMRRAGKKTCYVYTTAMEVAPVGWREQRPIVWLSMSEDESEPLNHMLDDGQRYQPNKPVKAIFEGEGGQTKPLEVKALSSHIQPVAMNAAGQAILNRDAIRGYTLGSMIELRGETPDGQPTTIRYSLLGYRSAVNAAALNCGRADLARDLVWK
jgi:hypothetical protein